jgi:pimeloyl-ACP methyl ester carboxylesterase
MSTATTPTRKNPIPQPAWLPPSVWPFQSFGIESHGTLLSVTDAGKGPVLLFVHVGAWSFIWRDLMTRLTSDFRCICFDAPGNGLSRDGSKSAVSIEGASRAVSTVISTLGLTDFTLVAHDLGGPAALAAVAATPERVNGIVGMNCFAWRPSGAAFRNMLAIVGSGPIRELDVLTGFIPRISATSFGVGCNLDQPSRQAFLAGMGPRARRAFHNYMHDALRCDGLYDRIATALAGPLARLPLLTIFGERNDPFGFQKRWLELFPDASQVVVAKGNHFPMCDAPDSTARPIRDWHRERVAQLASQ